MISVRDLSFSYAEQPVLQDISLEITAGEFTGIIGPNGAGKSTLLKLLDRLLKPAAGEIRLEGKSLAEYSRRALARVVGFVPQRFSTGFNFSAGDIVMMGRYPHQGTLALESEQDLRVAEEAMRRTDCLKFRHRPFLSLSGGERQRVVLASALCQEPRVLLLDEPTNALDLKHQVHFYDILTTLQHEQQLTILTVTHDVNLAARYCRRLLVLKNGRLLADGLLREVLSPAILQELYEIPVEQVFHPVSGAPVIFPR